MTPAPGTPPTPGDNRRESETPRDANATGPARLFDLLADHALGELAPAEVQEMNALLADHPELAPAEAASLEEAAAVLAVAELSGVPELEVPPGLRGRLADDAQAFVSEPSPRGEDASAVTSRASDLPDKRPSTQAVLAFIGGGLIGGLAAAVLVALLLADPADKSTPPIAVLPTPAESYALYEQNTPGIAEHDWATTAPGYEATIGEVLWSDQTQTGYLVFENLPENDPAQAQYQLWIVDPARDEFPVDGGVFNLAEFIDPDGKAYVPIDAKLPVRAPAAFAITLEKPGGVVKSNNPLLVVAPAAVSPS